MANIVDIEVAGARGLAINLNQWKIVPHWCTVSDGDGSRGWDDPTASLNGSKIVLTAAELRRHGNEDVAQLYASRGHDMDLDFSRGWPDSDANGIEVNKVADESQSEQMCVNGETHWPHKMNFFFHVDITTAEGFTMKLILGQSHVGAGIWSTVKNLYDAGKSAAKACDAFEDGDDYALMKQSYKFGKAVDNLFDSSKNLWHLTAVGTLKHPSSLFDYRPADLFHKKNPKASHTRLLCTGETTAKGYEGYIQAAAFHVLSGDHTFGLKVYPPRKREAAA